MRPEDKFEEIWRNYPRKLGKAKARRFFLRQVRSESDFKRITKALDNFNKYLAEKGTEEQFIPYGSTWFNEMWEDWEEYVPKGSQSKYEVYQDEYEQKYGGLK